jgi:RNA polymerase sigma-70 factor, ECF subfamily
MDLKENFIQLMEQHQGIILTLCRAYYQDEEDRHDARQDIILQLWKSFPSFRNECKVSTWMHQVGLNTILAKLRKEKKQPVSEPLDKLLSIHFADGCTADDDLQQLKYLISTLKEVDKAIMLLYLEGYENKEIADILNLTSTNLSTRMNRIKNTLKEKYKIKKYDLG